MTQTDRQTDRQFELRRVISSGIQPAASYLLLLLLLLLLMMMMMMTVMTMMLMTD